MRFLGFSLAVVLLVAAGSAADAYEGIGGEYAPNVYSSSPNSIGDIKGEFRTNLHRDSRNAIGDSKGEFGPNFDDDRPTGYYGGPSWLEALEYLLGYGRRFAPAGGRRELNWHGA